jgi:hypothetical protein
MNITAARPTRRESVARGWRAASAFLSSLSCKYQYNRDDIATDAIITAIMMLLYDKHILK